jgi:hypothetical protein
MPRVHSTFFRHGQPSPSMATVLPWSSRATTAPYSAHGPRQQSTPTHSWRCTLSLPSTTRQDLFPPNSSPFPGIRLPPWSNSAGDGRGVARFCHLLSMMVRITTLWVNPGSYRLFMMAGVTTLCDLCSGSAAIRFLGSDYATARSQSAASSSSGHGRELHYDHLPASTAVHDFEQRTIATSANRASDALGMGPSAGYILFSSLLSIHGVHVLCWLYYILYVMDVYLCHTRACWYV